jgi:CHC2 zinc finger
LARAPSGVRAIQPGGANLMIASVRTERISAMSESRDPAAHRARLAYLALIAGTSGTGRFLDVRWRRPEGAMRRRFMAAECLSDAAALISTLAPENDVYVGVALRDSSRQGGRAAVSGLQLAYVESDACTAERLVSFSHPPSMVVASGTPGHVQVYWLLQGRCSPGRVESANRRLALALAADPACADAARILRPPGTFNHKHDPPRPVTLLVLREHARYTLAGLTDGLPEDPVVLVPERSGAPRRSTCSQLDRDLLAIPAVEYVQALAGLSPNREGKVLCPFHAEAHPSLQLYPDGGFYCFGSGCKAGGTIFDFAARLWDITPRGAGFIEIRERLATRFGNRSVP